MATSLVSPLSGRTIIDNRTATGVPETSFPHGTKLSVAPYAVNTRSRTARRWRCRSRRSAKSFDHIPKQFRGENLADGLMDNYKNVPKSLFSLLTEDNPLSRLCGSDTKESISVRSSYSNYATIPQVPVSKSKPVEGIPWTYGVEPPDVESVALDQRIILLNMPFYPDVAQLAAAKFLYLDFVNNTKPIYLYINSTGCQDLNKKIVALDSEAYLIADAMALCKSRIITVNTSKAYGQAAMLLSLGAKGSRGLTPNCSTSLSMPRTSRSFGSVSDLWRQAQEMEVMADYYVELLAEGIGKPKEVIAKDLQRHTRYFTAEAAIEYGIADKIMKGKSRYEDDEEEPSEIPGVLQAIP